MSELDDQLLDSWIDSGASWISSVHRAVKLSRDELPVPGQQGLRFDHRHHFRQGLFPEAFAECGQRGPLAVREPHPSRNLVPKNAVFRD